MGWADCGKDSLGRDIGYAFEAICDHPGCEERIHRGLAYACGGMHGDCGGEACEGYFCYEHLKMIDKEGLHTNEIDVGQLCPNCYEELRNRIGEYVLSGDYYLYNPDFQEVRSKNDASDTKQG